MLEKQVACVWIGYVRLVTAYEGQAAGVYGAGFTTEPLARK